MAKRQKTTRFSIQSYDAAHYRQTEQYTQVVNALFDRATTEIAKAVAKGTYDPDKPFSFDDYPGVKSVMQGITKQLADRMITVIETGSKKQWLFACEKNDGFIASIMDTSKLSKARLKKMQDRNLEALQTFQGRKVEGMNLSQRVWKYVGQYKAQLESALDVGLGEGRSAAQLSRDVRENLKEPNRLFRRVRDKRGNLVLSKAAKAFHPGQGVYRSSYKNAMRLTRSEINMAYRESDFLRWQSLDFVVGYEIRRSNHEPLFKCDICEKLVGRYPKTFKFKGWHPQCMCYAVPILMDEETFDENELGDLKAALHGTQYKKLEAKNLVTDVPDGFKQWVKDHEEAQKKWASTPYFIKDNFKNGKLSEGLKIAMPTIPKIDPVQQQFDALQPQIALMRQSCLKWGLSIQLSMLDKYVQDKDITRIQSRLSTIQARVTELEQKDASVRAKCREWGLNTYILDDAMKNPDSVKILQAMEELEDRVKDAEKEYKQFIADATKAIQDAHKAKVDATDVEADLAAITADKREWVMGKTSIKKHLSDLQKAINDASDVVIHPAMKTSYTKDKDVDDTMKQINAEFKTERWFEHGDCVLTPTRKSGVNGFTYMDGRISLRPERVEYVKSAMAKIGQGKSNEITFEEADAMATFWHEITHNRNVPGNMWITSTQTDIMEMMNEFVARKTLPEFYAKMGCPTTPHPEFITNRASTGYNRRVIGYDFVIQKLGLDPDKVLKSARKNLFELKYSEQETTAIQALLDGGLDKFKGANGKKLGKAQIKKLVAMCRKGMSTTTIENYLKNEKIIN
ncbi:MAG: minor capsid protein 2 [Bacteriophage sp.]|nr:MAG: minor capsid protein 2 [Bacteriophage sp.]